MSATDTAILLGFFAFFLILGGIMPFLNTEFGQSNTEYVFDFEPDGNIFTSAWTILSSIVTMFFWSFGSLPLIMDLLMVIPRVFFYFIIAKVVRGVGT